MIGSLITRGLLLIFGYAYPAYECYKTVEQNKPDISRLRFWCQYWILVAGLTVAERIGHMFIGWVPMYGEVKLAILIYLWAPKTKGATYVYESFFRPYIAKHETEIDRNLLKLRTRVVDMAILYYQKAASSYGETRVYDVLLHTASQATHYQPCEIGSENLISATSLQPYDETSSCAPSTSSREQQPKLEAVKALAIHESRTPTSPTPERSKILGSTEGNALETDSMSPVADEIAQSPKGIVLE